MNKDIAGRIVESARALGDEINKLDSQISQINDAKEKDEFVRALGGIMGILTRDIVLRLSVSIRNSILTASRLLDVCREFGQESRFRRKSALGCMPAASRTITLAALSMRMTKRPI